MMKSILKRTLKRTKRCGLLLLVAVIGFLLAQCGTEAEDALATMLDPRTALIAGGTITVPAVDTTTDGATVVGSAKVVFFTGAAGLELTEEDFAVTNGGAVGSVSMDGDKVTIVVTFPANTSLSPKIYNVVIASTSEIVRGAARVRIIHLGINGASIELPPVLYVSSTGNDDNYGQTADTPFRTLAYAYAQAVSDPVSKRIVVLTDIDAGDEAMVLNGSIAVNPPEITITSGTPRRMLTRTGNADSSEAHDSPYFGPSVVRVEGGAKVVFQDIAITGGTRRGLGVYGGGNMVTLNNTEITGKSSYGVQSSTHVYGGGVLLSNSADPPSKITMNGGSIYGEDSPKQRIHGYGVAIKNDQYASDFAEFEMNGGTIYGKATFDDYDISYGGGVYNSGGTFTMNDGTIYGNGVYQGGGVYISNGGSFTMNGASRVSGGVGTGVGGVNSGGGVYMQNGSFTMNDYSTISGSSAYLTGGGVYIFGNTGASFTMNDHSTVSGNTAEYWGGGVYQLGTSSITTFKMNDDSAVSGNTAGTEGGGVYIEDGIDWNFLLPVEFEMHGNSVIYGSDETDETLRNTAVSGGAAMYHKYHYMANATDVEVLTPIDDTLNAGNYLDWLKWEP